MLKRKHKNTPRKAPENLWFQKSFAFVIPRSFDDCCSHIEQLGDGVFSSYNSVYLSSVDQQQIAFDICKSGGRSGSVWAVGYLQAEAEHSTRIVGKVGIPRFDILFAPIVFGIIGLIFALNLYLSRGLIAFCSIGLFMGIILLITWVYLIGSREGLINDLKWLGQRVE